MTNRCGAGGAGAILLCAAVGGWVVSGCAGPQPLHVAIRNPDEQAYLEAMRQHPASPRDAFFAARAAETGRTIADVARADALLSDVRNPFDANRDPAAVSRGAVIYRYNCMSCHGENVDGWGEASPVQLSDFHGFAKRFAVTLHRGAPRTWFRKTHDGSTRAAANPDGTHAVMPAFRDTLAREQIWLAITYLQSLDMYAAPSAPEL